MVSQKLLDWKHIAKVVIMTGCKERIGLRLNNYFSMKSCLFRPTSTRLECAFWKRLLSRDLGFRWNLTRL
uniref:Uncharacterized protein n=1 Tax=Globisporangium ultimum (strain ATCC 200006 / CBS 805.95 / DAOM BR144) TaxID=431595 RepID=K3XDJ2_GLOUD